MRQLDARCPGDGEGYTRLDRDLRATPGVIGVTTSFIPALAGSNWGTDVNVEGVKRGRAPWLRRVTRALLRPRFGVGTLQPLAGPDPRVDAVWQAVRQRRLFAAEDPEGRAAQSVRQIARGLLQGEPMTFDW